MMNLLGEFECKLDSKFRLALPAALRKQLPPQADGRFVVNRGFEKHLTLYPLTEWQIVSAEVNRLNMYVKKHREFARYFHRGATELTLDSAGRVLLPKRLVDYAGIQEAVILLAYANRIECWDSELYDTLLASEPEDFARLAEEIMSGGEPGPEREEKRPEYRDMPFPPPGPRH
jgi:MraZ protein